MSFRIVIPARYASSRLPGKPLLDIGGKPMIWHTWQRALEAAESPRKVIIATDDDWIMKTCSDFGARVAMTSVTHENGTERLAEVARNEGWDKDEIVVNVQGDEPLLPPALISKVALAMKNSRGAAVATLACRIRDASQLANPAIVKCVLDRDGYARYFSRAVVPFARDANSAETALQMYGYLRHIGMYAYRVATLAQVASLEPSPTEEVEKLEQLRPLWHGLKIHVSEVEEAPPHGVDTEADLEAVRQILAGA